MQPQERFSDLRRQLEGLFELVESAPARYAALEQALRGADWMVRLRQHSASLPEWLAQEPMIDEGLERLHRRAHQEGWAKEDPALVLARQVEARRLRLRQLLQRRLGAKQPVPLSAFEQLVQQVCPAQDEQVLVEGGGSVDLWQALSLNQVTVALLCTGLLAWMLLPLLYPEMTRIFKFAAVGLFGLWVARMIMASARQRRGSGSYWVSWERLVWSPNHPAHAVQVPLGGELLASVHYFGGQRRHVSLSLKDGRMFELKRIAHAELLAAVLLIRMRLLRGRPAKHPVECACLHASASFLESGLAVILPGRVTFLPLPQNDPQGRHYPNGARLLEGFLGPLQLTSVPDPEPWMLLALLRWLPEAEFERGLQRATAKMGGLQWKTAELLSVRPETGGVNGPLLELIHKESQEQGLLLRKKSLTLSGTRTREEMEAVRELLTRNPPQAALR